jgi:hypothetical protein
MLPAQMRGGRIHEKRELTVQLAIAPDKVDAQIEAQGRSQKRRMLLRLLRDGEKHPAAELRLLIRDPMDFHVLEKGKHGIIQVVSMLPESYPGHSLLTEDEGEILGEDDCPCGRKGKYFRIFGRLKNAEIRGCSDTYAAKFEQR